MRSFANHSHPGVPQEKVISNLPGALAWALHRRLMARPRTIQEIYRWEVDNSRWFATQVGRSLRKRHLDPQRDCFFGFQCECLEALKVLQSLGIWTVLDLTGPGQVEDQLVRAEADRWPDWAVTDPLIPQFYYDRLREEWTLANIVLVNSPWSKRAWIEQGVPAQKIIVVPLAYEPDAAQQIEPRSQHERLLTVLWLGSVILRKGIPYLIEAAKALRETNIRFVVAGGLGISHDAVASAPDNMTFIGRVARDQAVNLYREADVFVLPTISDGFAITQLEAMAHGVPVIATPNCGEVVSPGVDGLIVPAGDSQSLAKALIKLDEDRALLTSMSRGAIDKSRQFSVRRYGERVNAAMSTARETPGKPVSPT